MAAYLLTFLMLFQSAAQPVAKDEIKASLTRAAALFDEARFNDSIQILLQVSEQLQTKSDRLADKVNAKLQLALANIGLNETEKARTFLVEMYTLDPGTTLDPQQFSPKVMALAGEAKEVMAKVSCQATGNEARNNLKQGNATAMRKLIASPDTKCVDMAALSSDASDLLYKTGMEAYKNADFFNALQNFQAAVKFSAKNELASQYIELAQGRLQVDEDRVVIQWQKYFDGHNLEGAAVEYRKMAAFNDAKLAPALRQAGELYRKALTTLVDTWNQACPQADMTELNGIRGQISQLLPDPAFGEDIRALMSPCAKPAKVEIQTSVRQNVPEIQTQVDAKPELKTVSLTANSNQCLQLDYRVAMIRINAKTRVDPEIPREARAYIQASAVTVRIRVRIDENGNVISTDTPGGNPVFNTAVRNAVERWKFSPALDASGARCVDTEIPIVIGPLTTR